MFETFLGLKTADVKYSWCNTHSRTIQSVLEKELEGEQNFKIKFKISQNQPMAIGACILKIEIIHYAMLCSATENSLWNSRGITKMKRSSGKYGYSWKRKLKRNVKKKKEGKKPTKQQKRKKKKPRRVTDVLDRYGTSATCCCKYELQLSDGCFWIFRICLKPVLSWQEQFFIRLSLFPLAQILLCAKNYRIKSFI